eukprot:s1275_g11.t1
MTVATMAAAVDAATKVLLQRLNTARHRAREAGAPQVSADNSGEVGFWEFVQLARELHTLHEKAKEQAMNQLMEECKFNQKEVNQFHEVFHHWYHIDDEGEADERRMEDDDPNAGLSREIVRRVVRQTGMSFTPEKKEILDKRLDGLEEAGLLRFHGFLRLMRWVIETDFAEMNAQLAELPSCNRYKLFNHGPLHLPAAAAARPQHFRPPTLAADGPGSVARERCAPAPSAGRELLFGQDKAGRGRLWHFAVKQLSKAKLSQGGKLRHNTEREVVMMRACQHENIAQLFGVFQDDKSVYLVMECCDGGDIGERVIGSKSNVHEEQLAEWSRQMCAAVAALHGLRICHRDLKPQNYMLTRNSMLKLSDFGLAVFLPEGQVLSERCGTPAFMSPELHLLPRKSRGYSFPADAWALGLCIYMVIYRHHPFVDSRGGLDESSLLTGRLTFGEDDSSLGSLLQSIKNGIGAGSPPPSGPGSIPEVRPLCAHLTHADETSRMTAAQALQSIWCGRGSRLRHAQAARSAATSAAQSDTSTQVSEPSRTSSKQSVSAGSSSGSGRLVSLGGYPQADDEPRSWASDSKILAKMHKVDSSAGSFSAHDIDPWTPGGWALESDFCASSDSDWRVLMSHFPRSAEDWTAWAAWAEALNTAQDPALACQLAFRPPGPLRAAANSAASAPREARDVRRPDLPGSILCEDQQPEEQLPSLLTSRAGPEGSNFPPNRESPILSRERASERGREGGREGWKPWKDWQERRAGRTNEGMEWHGMVECNGMK